MKLKKPLTLTTDDQKKFNRNKYHLHDCLISFFFFKSQCLWNTAFKLLHQSTQLKRSTAV